MARFDSERLTLAVLAAVAAVLRIPTLGVQSYWGDEAATVAVLGVPLGDLYDAISASESTPPLYYALAWPWTRVFGDEEFALRLLSALFSIGAVPVLALAGARLAGRRGLWAGGLVAATNPLLQWFGQEARAYALLVLLVACATLALLHTVERPGPRPALLWGLAAAGALATHWFAVFVVAPQAVWLLAAARRDARAVACALTPPAVAGLALLPLLLDQREADRASFIRDESLPSRVVSLAKQWVVGYDAPGELLLGIVAGAIVVAAVVAVRARIAEPLVRGLVLVLLASLLLPLLAAAIGDDYVLTRNLLASLAVAVPLLAAGLAGLPAPTVPVLAAVWVAVTVGVSLDPSSQREDWRGIADALGPASRPRVIAVLPGSGRVGAEHYLEGAATFAEPVRVAEIDVVAVATGSSGERREVPELPLGPVWGGFRLQEVDRGEGYTVARWLGPESDVDPSVLGAIVPHSVALRQGGR